MHHEPLPSAGDWRAQYYALASLLRADVNATAAHMERMSWPTLVALAIEARSPTEGPLAWAIWRKSNTEPDAPAACRAMRQAGYAPFQGYPLQRYSAPISPGLVLSRSCQDTRLMLRPPTR